MLQFGLVVVVAVAVVAVTLVAVMVVTPQLLHAARHVLFK